MEHIFECMQIIKRILHKFVENIAVPIIMNMNMRELLGFNAYSTRRPVCGLGVFSSGSRGPEKASE